MRWLRAMSGARAWVAGALVLAVGLLGWGALALSAPAARVGNPTIPVTPPPPKPTVSATPDATASASASTTPTTSASAAPRTAPALPATGKYNWSSLTVPPTGSEGTLRRYAVAVETGALLKANTAAALIAATLNDPRSWTGAGTVRFELVPPVDRDDPTGLDLVIYLASAKTAAKLCGTEKEAAYSCVNGSKVVVNAEYWVAGATGYGGDLEGLRRFLVNHAVGHFLGKKHEACAKAGKPAPVMLQQAAGLGGCTPNPWPNG